MAPLEYNRWTGEYEETSEPAAPAAAPTAVSPDPLTTIGGAPATPVPGMDTGPQAASPSAPSAASGSWDEPIDYSGGLWSDIKAVAGSVPKEAAAIGRSLTRLPQVVYEGVKEATVGGLLGPAPGTPEWKKEQAERKEKEQGLSKVESIGRYLEESPAAALVPGSFTVSNLLQGDAEELGQHPLVTALDLLPIVSKGGKLATKGSGFADSAAARATEIGRIAKADRIANKGMKLPEIGQEALRQAEAKAVQRFPKMYGKTPAAVLEKAGVAGERLRQSLNVLGARSRSYTKEVVDTQKRIREGAAEFHKLGIDDSAQSRLLDEAERADRTWWDSRTSDERAFLDWHRQMSDELFEQYDKTFEYGGERYTKAQAPGLYKHWRRAALLRKGLANPESAAPVQARRQTLLGKSEARMEKLAQTSAPARFGPLVNEQMRPRVEQLLDESRRSLESEGVAFPMPEEMVANLLDSGAYRQFADAGVISADDLARIGREVTATWQELRAAGFDPMYHHHVTGTRRAKLSAPRFDPIHLLKEPSAIKRRGWDMEPWVPEATVSLLDQAVDLIHAKHAASWLDDLETHGMLKNSEQVAAEVGDAAQRIVSQLPRERQAAALPEVIDQLRRNNFTEFSPSSAFALRGGKMSGDKTNVVYMPKGIAKVTEDIARPPKLPPIARVPMRVFRASVLYLNPGYYANQAIGNTLMLAFRSNPADLRFLPKAVKAFKRGELPLEISMGPVLGTADESFRVGLRRMGWQAADELDGLWSKLGNKVQRAETFLQSFAGAIDDMSKATAYFAELNRATKKGASADLAMARAMEHMRRVNMSFDTLSPLERQVMRGVLMPFYSWAKFALGYVMSYPFDHPYRAAVLNGLSRQVREEWDDGLPQRFMGYWPVGQGPDGQTKLYPAGGAYPFLSFFNTDDIWAGFLRRTSPILQTAQEFSGVDPFTGAPDPYLSFHKDRWEPDPVTGRPRYIRPDISELLTEGFLTQSEGIRIAFNALDEDDKKYYRENPGRYWEDMLRAFGVTIPITRDLNEERSKWKETQSRFAPKKEPVSVGAAPPAPATTPAPPTPAPSSGLTYNRWTGKYE